MPTEKAGETFDVPHLETMDQMAGNHGQPKVIKLSSGKRVKFKLIDQSVKQAIENHQVGIARQQCLDERDQTDQDTWQTMWAAFLELRSKRTFAWGSSGSMSFLKSFAGVVLLLTLVSDLTEEEVNKLASNKADLDKVIGVLREVVHDSFPAPEADESGQKKSRGI